MKYIVRKMQLSTSYKQI